MTDQLSPNNPKCNQCGFHHPPLKEGENCPMAKQTDNYGTEIEIGEEITQIKNILVANIQKKGIKDHKKFVRHLIVKLNKHIEEYSEE